MRGSDQKFFEILQRHGISPDLGVMSVAMNRSTFGGRQKVTFYGVGQPIPPAVAEDIRVSLFPLIMAEKPDFGASNDGAEISKTVLDRGLPAKQQADFALHCALADAGR